MCELHFMRGMNLNLCILPRTHQYGIDGSLRMFEDTFSLGAAHNADIMSYRILDKRDVQNKIFIFLNESMFWALIRNVPHIPYHVIDLALVKKAVQKNRDFSGLDLC